MAEKKIVRVVNPGEKPNPKVELFCIHGETYTLGQPLAHMLLAHPDVKFAGVNKVHPSDNNLLLKVEIKEESNTNGVDVLKQVLSNLYNQFDHILQTFKNAVDEFEDKQESKMDVN